MSLIRRKDRKRYMAELLPPATWQEDVIARMGEDWGDPNKEGDQEHRDLMAKLHRSRRDAAVKALIELFDGFDITQFKILDVIPVLYMGWECDYLAWVVKYKEKKYVIGTDHGSLRFLMPSDLKKYVSNYEQAIIHTNKAIADLDTSWAE